MKRVLCVGAACASFLVVGCATTVGGNESGGVVTGNGLTMATQKKFAAAEANCAKFGKVARVRKISAWDGTLTYECVAKEAQVQ